MMYIIDQELDQRRDEVGDGANVGVWPGHRVIICERMIVFGSKCEVNELLDGGFGLEVKGFDQFKTEFADIFMEPMGFFCKAIDDMLEGRLHRLKHHDAVFRCLQHLLVDLVVMLDTTKAYIAEDPARRPKCNKSSRGCDCADCADRDTNLNEILKARQRNRYHEEGLWPVNGILPSRSIERHNTTKSYVDGAGKEFPLGPVKRMTYYVKLD